MATLRPGTKPAHAAVDLVTSLTAVKAPLAKVLTIVREQSVLILADTRACPPNDLLRSKSCRRTTSHRYGPTAAEVPQRNLFHRSPGQEPGNGTAVDDLSGAHVDTMMNKTGSRCDQVRPDRRLLRVAQNTVASGAPGEHRLALTLRHSAVGRILRHWPKQRRPPGARPRRLDATVLDSYQPCAETNG